MLNGRCGRLVRVELLEAVIKARIMTMEKAWVEERKGAGGRETLFLSFSSFSSSSQVRDHPWSFAVNFAVNGRASSTP